VSGKLLTVGFLILLFGFCLLVAGAAGQGGGSVGGAVFIGPFPIVFGSGPSGPELALISVVIGAVMVGLIVLWGWRSYVRRID